MKKIGQFLQSAWLWVTGRFKNITSEDNIEASISFVNTIKDLANSQIAGWLTSLTATGIDDRILQIIKDRAPKALSSLLLLKNIPNNATHDEIVHLLESFRGIINDGISDRERLLNSLAADILIALEDGKLKFAEAAIIIEKHYQKL